MNRITTAMSVIVILFSCDTEAILVWKIEVFYISFVRWTVLAGQAPLEVL